MRLCFIVLILAISYNVLSAKIILGPYPQAVTQNSAIVMVECDNNQPVTALYNTKGEKSVRVAASVSKKTTKGTFVFRINLEGLKPGTEYGIKSAQKDMDEATNSIYFKTLPLQGAKFSFAILGSSHSNIEVSSEIANLMKAHKPNFSIFLGDIASSPAYENWKNEFFTKDMLDFNKSTPFFNAVGKSEKWTENTEAFTQSPNSFPENQAFYSFEAGDAFFLILSTEHDISSGSKQWEFAKNALSKTNKKWKVVAFNTPAYCNGCPNVSENMQKVSDELFPKYDVNIVLSGNAGFYQHNIVNNIHHLVIAGGGSPLIDPGISDSNEPSLRLETGKSKLIKSSREYHYAIAEVSNNQLAISVINIAGTEIDKIVLE